MDIPATPALAQFETDKNDPKVQALQSFIMLTLGKRLGQVLHWNIALYTPGIEDTRPFSLELTDRSQIEGTLHRHKQPEYRMLRPGESEYIWSVDNGSRKPSLETIEKRRQTRLAQQNA